MAQKKTILVTGCSDHTLGSVLAIALHGVGWRVFASARNLAKMTAVKAAGIECIQMDVNSEESIAAAVEQVEKKTGGALDGLVNNAGGGYSMPIIHADLDATRDLFELNVYSLIRVSRALVPLLLKSSHNPILVNNTSASGMLGCGTPFQGIYAASKAAATSLTEMLRRELAPFGVVVINLVTGGVTSTFYDNSNKAVLPPDSIYNIAKEALETPMNGDQPGLVKTDPIVWANQVAKDISQRSPPHLVWRGKMAGTARFATLLPLGLLDGITNKMAGVDVLEKKIKEQKALDKLKSA